MRAFDLRARRLMREPVVDPREPDEVMNGLPLTRATSAEGRWAYTLYDRPGSEPFIHALDTERRTAACIDLPRVTVAGLGALSLALADGGRTLRVEGDGGPVRLVDTRTFAVRRPEPAVVQRPPTAPAVGGDEGDGGPLWALGAVPLLAVLGLVARRRRPARALRAPAARP